MSEPIAVESLRLSYDDFRALPDDGKRYEIVDGELYKSPSPQTLYQRIVLRLARTLADHVEQDALGEVFVAPFDVLLSDHDVVEPDLIYVAASRREIVTENNIRGVPDLLVEIVSPSRVECDTRNKRAVYARCGVPWYWIVDPAQRRFTELELGESAYGVKTEITGDAVFQPALFPELHIELSRIWALTIGAARESGESIHANRAQSMIIRSP